jgi:integrase
MYLSARLERIIVRDFRTVDAGSLLADIHREHKVGRTTLKHIKSFLSGVFTYAKNQGAFDGVNPVRDAMIPKKAEKPLETYAVSPDEVLAMMKTLDEAGQPKASAAVGLLFFAGLRPGEARGVRWEDLDGRRLHIRQSVWHTHATSPKTEGSEKSVPVIEPLASILADLRELDKNPSSGPVLRGPSGRPLDLNNLAVRVVIPTLKEAGIEWHGRYALRRGVATAIRRSQRALSPLKDCYAIRALAPPSGITSRTYRKHSSCHGAARSIV